MKHIGFDLDSRSFCKGILSFLDSIPRTKLPRIIDACISKEVNNEPFKLSGNVIFSSSSRLSFVPDTGALSKPGFLRFLHSSTDSFRAAIAKKSVSLYFSEVKNGAENASFSLEKSGITLNFTDFFTGGLAGLDLSLTDAVNIRKRVLRALLGKPVDGGKDKSLRSYVASDGGKLRVFLPSDKVGVLIQSSLSSLDRGGLLKLDMALSSCMGRAIKGSAE